MPFRHAVAVLAVTVAAGCSRQAAEPSSLTPTGPSAVAHVALAGEVSRPALVDFPPRPDALDFRTQLETKYTTGLGRRPAQTVVDMEGEATWIGEYDRYRVNGCDHDTATQRALSQIDGAAPAPVCAIRFFPETAVYPPRDHVVDFRRQLGAKYQAMGRSAQSAVDPDGAAIWISEYLRYRASGCDHATAVQKVMTQVDGNPAPETCLVQCAYSVSPSAASVGSAGGTLSVEMIRTSGSCDWLALNDVPWITLNRPVSGSNRNTLSYTVAANTGTSRAGTIRISYPSGETFLNVIQASPSSDLSFQFFDPARSTNPTTECQIRSNGTICTVTASTANPATIASYDWHVEYAYGGVKVRSQVGTLPTFSFTESCGASASDGSPIPLSVRLIATDTSGNSTTLYSGQGSQPALQLRIFNCS